MKKPKKTQMEKVVERLQSADGEWVSGQIFLRELYLSQYHARIFEAQRKGFNIQASDFTDDFGFKSYRLVRENPEQTKLW